MMTTRPPLFPLNNRCARKGEQGFSLVELMISIVIGLLIVTALLAVYLNSTSASTSNQNTSELLNNGRFALDTLREDLRQAGFKGYSWALPNTPTTTLTPITNECLESGATAGTFVANIAQGVWGANDANPFSGGTNCLPNYLQGDVLVIRRLDSTPVTTLNSGTFYYRSNYAMGEVFRGAPTTACSAAPQSTYTSPFNKVPCIVGTPSQDLLNFPVIVHVYYIRSYTTSTTESPLLPALVRVSLQTDGSMASEVVASGIENLQLQYGRASTDGNTRYYDASSISGNSTTPDGTEWTDVDSVRLWLLARNSTKEPTYTNSTTYAMGTSSSTVSDNYRRQLFNTVVQLRNP